MNMDMVSLLKRLGIPEVPHLGDLFEGSAYLSKLGAMNSKGKQYTDDFDWKMVKGIVVRPNIGQRKDGSQFGSYIINDDSLGTEKVTSTGTIVPSTFQIWCDPTLVNWGQDSEIVAFGTITPDQNGIPRMNAIGIIPIKPFPIITNT